MKIKKNLKNIPIKILDIGCGKGEFLSILRDECISYLGIDVDSFVINSCKEKKLSCLKQDIVKFAKENKEEYTAITAFQVIEHLSDPYSFLKAVRGTLKKNGLFLLTTPNNNTPLRKILKSKWFSYNEKEHFVFYNKITLAKLLKSIGFRNISITNDLPRCLSLGYSLYKFVQYYLIDYFLLNKLTPLCQRLKLPIISDPLGDLEALSIK